MEIKSRQHERLPHVVWVFSLERVLLSHRSLLPAQASSLHTGDHSSAASQQCPLIFPLLDYLTPPSPDNGHCVLEAEKNKTDSAAPGACPPAAQQVSRLETNGLCRSP